MFSHQLPWFNVKQCDVNNYILDSKVTLFASHSFPFLLLFVSVKVCARVCAFFDDNDSFSLNSTCVSPAVNIIYVMIWPKGFCHCACQLCPMKFTSSTLQHRKKQSHTLCHRSQPLSSKFNSNNNEQRPAPQIILFWVLFNDFTISSIHCIQKEI